MKSKRQLNEESVNRFKIKLQETRNELQSLDEKLSKLDEMNIYEATPQAMNILGGMRRDILYGKDSVIKIIGVLKVKL